MNAAAKVVRYDPYVAPDVTNMVMAMEGTYVTHADYKALEENYVLVCKFADDKCEELAALRARVAELVEAGNFSRDVFAEIYAKYQIKIGPYASQAQVANGKLRAALEALK